MKDEQKYFDKLATELTDRISASLKGQIEEVKEENKEAVAKLKETNDVIAERIKAIENMPAKDMKVAVDVPGKDKKVHFYKGYDLRKQGQDISIAPKYMVADEDREMVSKWLIDVIHGKATNVEGTASRGGYLVPDQYGDMVMAHARLQSIILNEANVINMSGDTLRIPKEATSVSTSWTAEEADLGETNPTFGEIVLQANRLGAYSIVSNELLADEQYDFVSLLTSQFGEAIGQDLDGACFNGVGTLTGALSGASLSVSCASSASSPSRHIQLTDAEISFAIAALTDNKLMGSKLYVRQESNHYLRQLKDSAGNPIYSPMANNQPANVWGYPVVVNQNVGVAAPGAAVPLALFGNLRKCYVVGRRMGGMVLEVDPYGLFNTYRTRFRMVTRWDGAVALADGLVKILTHA